jgi:hypothetical protein
MIAINGKAIEPHTLYRVFKYTIYILLAADILYWYQEDLAASAEIFGDTISWGNVVEAFSATVDTFAWVVLLLLFELETAVLSDEQLEGRLKWVLMALRLGCYFLIVWAFYGYWAKYGVVTNLLPFHIEDLCSLVGTDWNYVADLDDYPPIDMAACTAMKGQELFQIAGTEIVGNAQNLKSAFGLSLVEVVNAGTWLIIVALLEVEVFLQLKDLLTDRMMRLGTYLKGFFYAVLFICAAYWGINGSFMDFWDAFLWLVAFIFIELNIFQWHEEVETAHGHRPESA